MIVQIELNFSLLVLLGLHELYEVLVLKPANVVVLLKLERELAAVIELFQVFLHIDEGFVGGVRATVLLL